MRKNCGFTPNFHISPFEFPTFFLFLINLNLRYYITDNSAELILIAKLIMEERGLHIPDTVIEAVIFYVELLDALENV